MTISWLAILVAYKPYKGVLLLSPVRYFFSTLGPILLGQRVTGQVETMASKRTIPAVTLNDGTEIPMVSDRVGTRRVEEVLTRSFGRNAFWGSC